MLKFWRRTPSAPSGPLTLDQALWLASSFATVHRISFDANLFAQRCPPPVAIDTFNTAVDELGLRQEWSTASLPSLLSRRLPVAVLLQDSNDIASTARKWALILNADEQQAWLIEQGAQQPLAVPIDELERRYLHQSAALWPKGGAAADPDSIEPRAARFGLRWFIPELAKHKPIWREILLASLVLQLMGLATPLFTQVIIDKVVVHRTNSTLIA
ncbi:MAG: peptidase domain-containing ABC transporter, partial [Candidatus Obscuribacterales bacterium]|nr:peptidase domain-containing ABC transporter [Steroidobacteraceae bacterium]